MVDRIGELYPRHDTGRGSAGIGSEADEIVKRVEFSVDDYAYTVSNIRRRKER